jgi:sulfur-oxidizing protein SoxZ
METGQRKDAAGKVVPAHFIQSLTVEVGGKKIVEGQIGTSVSRNPVFGFKMKGAKVGDKVVVSWVDNKGDKRTDEAAVA